MPLRLSLAEATTLVTAALERNSVQSQNAASVARALVAAEAAGQDGHGLRRVPAYALQAKAGKVDGAARPALTRAASGGLRIDVAHGFAYPAIDLALRELPGLAREQGIAFASLTRSHHAGVLGLAVEQLADQGLVALMFANAPASIAPWGGKRPVFGTNPIAFAAPIEEEEPLVIDLALSKVARGKVMAARQRGEAIPEGWAFDRDGHPTTDAAAGLAGTMVPAGAAKGAALALMVEILSASLTGANYSYEASSLFDDKGAPPSLGQFMIAIDPQATGAGDVAARIGLLARLMLEEPEVRLPGRRGQTARSRALTEGVEVEEGLIREIEAL